MGGALNRYLAVLVGGAVLLALPLFAGPFQLTLATQGVAWGILALGVWLMLRILRLPSFGHAAFFGVGAYAAGLAVTRWDVENVFVALALSVALASAVALPIALVVGRLQSISFLLVTLAFAEMLHALALQWNVLGGSDGLVGVIRPEAAPLPIDLSQPADFYYFAVAVLAASLVVLLLIVRSPFGGVLVGIRESQDRMAALGYNALAYRVAAFVVSAAIAGAAGAVNAYLNRFVDPADVSALVSARGLLVVVIGGGSLLGPPVAGITLTELEDFLSSHTDRWLGIVGALYIAVALLALDRARVQAMWAQAHGVLRLGGARRARPVKSAEEKP